MSTESRDTGSSEGSDDTRHVRAVTKLALKRFLEHVHLFLTIIL